MMGPPSAAVKSFTSVSGLRAVLGRKNGRDDMSLRRNRKLTDPSIVFVPEGVNKLRTADNAIILVTHYQRLLNFIVPDMVHVLAGGRIVKEGGKELALELEEKGYDWVKAATK